MGNNMDNGCSAYFDGLKLTRKQIVFLALLSIGIFLEQMDLYNYAALSPAIKKSWSLTDGQVGLILAGFSIGAIFAALTFGNLADKIGRKKTMAIACIVGGAGSLLSGMSPNFSILIATRILAGFGMAGALLIGTPYLVEMVPSDKRAKYQAMLGLFGLISVPLSSTLAKKMVASNMHNWRYVAVIPSIGIVVGILFIFFAYESPRWLVSNNRIDEGKKVFKEITGKELLVEPDFECIIKKPTYAEAFKIMFSQSYIKRTVLFFVIFAFLYNAGFMFMQWLPTLLTNEGMSMAKALSYQQIASFALLISPFYVMFVGDKGGRKIPYAAALYFISAGLFLIAFAGSKPSILLTVGVFMVGSLYICNQGLASVYISECFPTRVRLIIIGIFSLIMRIGSVITNKFVAPKLYDTVGFSIYFVILAVTYVVVASLILILGPRTAGVTLEELNKTKKQSTTITNVN